MKTVCWWCKGRKPHSNSVPSARLCSEFRRLRNARRRHRYAEQTWDAREQQLLQNSGLRRRKARHAAA